MQFFKSSSKSHSRQRQDGVELGEVVLTQNVPTTSQGPDRQEDAMETDLDELNRLSINELHERGILVPSYQQQVDSTDPLMGAVIRQQEEPMDFVPQQSHGQQTASQPFGTHPNRNRKRGNYNRYSAQQGKDALYKGYVEKKGRQEIAAETGIKYATLTRFLRNQEKKHNLPKLPREVTSRRQRVRSALTDADGEIQAFIEAQIRPQLPPPEPSNQ